MSKFILCLLFPILAFAGSPETFRGFVQVKEGRQLFVDWRKAQTGQPTVVLINGLTYSTQQWERFTEALTARGLGVFRYDPIGMGETLHKFGPIREDIQINDQVEDLHLLLQVVGLQKDIHLVGLSYGGGLGLLYTVRHPENVRNLILMAPYTEPLKAQDQWIKLQIQANRLMVPWNPATDDELYAFFYRQIVYATYPYVEPVVLQHPWALESVFHMGLGIRKFLAGDVVKDLPAGTTHLMIAENDQYVPRSVMNEFWDKVPASAKGSRILIQNSEHKIPEAMPHLSAGWVAEIVLRNPAIQGGKDFVVNPKTGFATFQGGKIQLPKER